MLILHKAYLCSISRVWHLKGESCKMIVTPPPPCERQAGNCPPRVTGRALKLGVGETCTASKGFGRGAKISSLGCALEHRLSFAQSLARSCGKAPLLILCTVGSTGPVVSLSCWLQLGAGSSCESGLEGVKVWSSSSPGFHWGLRTNAWSWNFPERWLQQQRVCTSVAEVGHCSEISGRDLLIVY